jgi:hypothetical protein
MLDALPNRVRFCCPNCGAECRHVSASERATISCHRCGEAIRVPTQPHPVECDGVAEPMLSPLAVHRTFKALTSLMYGHFLVLLQAVLVFAAYFLWSTLEGPAKVLRRDMGGLQTFLVALWLIDLLLLFVQSAFKWLGYQRLEMLGEKLESLSWVTLARFGVLIRGLGYGLSAMPWILAIPSDPAKWEMNAFVQLGHVTWLVGILMEFGILVVWYRQMAEADHANGPRAVTRYITWTIATLFVLTAMVSLASMSMIVQLRKLDPKLGNPVDVAQLPPESTQLLLLFLTLLMLGGVLLSYRYLILLREIGESLMKPYQAS